MVGALEFVFVWRYLRRPTIMEGEVGCFLSLSLRVLAKCTKWLELQGLYNYTVSGFSRCFLDCGRSRLFCLVFSKLDLLFFSTVCWCWSVVLLLLLLPPPPLPPSVPRFSRTKYKDNYTAAVGSGEVVTGEERAETIAFIEAIMATPCMKYAHAYLAAKGQAPESETSFKVCLAVARGP